MIGDAQHVGSEQVPVSVDEEGEVLGSGLLLPLDDHLHRHRRSTPERAHPGGVQHDPALVVGGPSTVQTAVPDLRVERGCRPLVGRAFQCQLVVALLNASIQVESIAIQHPTVRLRRAPDGSGNWIFNPAEKIRNSRLLEQVRLDQITLNDGLLVLSDDRRGGQAELKNVNATFAALNLAGPWRSAGSFDYDGMPLAFTANMGTWANDEPLSLALRVSSRDNSGYSYSLDGKSQGGRFDGTLRLDPTQSPDGRSDTEGQLRPMTYKSKIAGNFDKVELSEIEIRPAGTGEQGTLLSGTASLAMNMLDEGTARRTSLQISEELAQLGAELGTGSGLDTCGVSLSTLKDKLDPALDHPILLLQRHSVFRLPDS